MPTFAWRCPFCNHNATIGNENTAGTSYSFEEGNKYGKQLVSWRAITCPNPSCHEYTFEVWIRDHKRRPGGSADSFIVTPRHYWHLVPAAEMKVFPDYVPDAIVADYKEACSIQTLSPKASATLARRCLQGIIRDFWKVNPGRLVDEIAAIHEKVHQRTWDAIEAVRKIGNIGAHMEKDIDLIVDVEPEEAKLLVGLIENLVEDWYVASHDRESRMSKLISAARDKKELRKKPNGAPDQGD